MAEDLASTLIDIANQYGADPELMLSIAKAESNLNPNAVSPKGAQNVMQIMPETFASYGGTDPTSVDQNLRVGAQHLAHLQKVFPGRQDLQAAAYNAGEGAVLKYGGVPPYKETTDYLGKVLGPQSGQYSGGQPYLPDPEFSLNKPNIADRLQQLAGLFGTIGGTTANVVSAVKNRPATGNSAFESGLQQLNSSAKTYDEYDKAKQVMDYLKDPRINKRDASLAASYVRAGDVDKALGVLSSAQQDSRAYNKALQLQTSGINVAINKTIGTDRAKSADLDAKQEAYDNFQNLKTEGKILTQNDLIKEKGLIRDLDKAGGLIEPYLRDKLQPSLQKMATSLNSAKSVVSLAENLERELDKVGTGRIESPMLTLRRIVEGNPELASSDLMKRILQAKTATGIMGESSRHSIQIEKDLGKMMANKSMTKEEIKAITNVLRGEGQRMADEQIGKYLSFRGSTQAGADEWKSRVGYRSEPNSPSEPNISDLQKAAQEELKRRGQ